MSDKIIRITDIVPVAEGDIGERISNAVEREPDPPKTRFVDLPKAPAGDFLTPQQVREFAERPDYTRKQPLTPKRPWTVNVGTSTPIPPGETRTFSEQMQILFRAKQMIAAASGGRLYITAAFVGQRVQLMQWSGNGMLVDFLRDRTDIDFDTAQPGINITFQVTNRGDTPGTFDITLFGEAAF